MLQLLAAAVVPPPQSCISLHAGCCNLVSRFAQEIPRLHNLVIDVVDVGMAMEVSLGRVKFFFSDFDLFVPDVPDTWATLWPLVKGMVSSEDGGARLNLSIGSAKSQGSSPALATQALTMVPEMSPDPHKAPVGFWLTSSAAAEAAAPSAPPASSSGGPRSKVGGPKASALGLACTSDLLDKGLPSFAVEFSIWKL